MLKKLTSKKAEGYVDVCICIFIILVLLVVFLNLFEFVTLKVQLDQIADELITTATYTGEFGTEFTDKTAELKSEYFDFTVATGADSYFRGNKVQLGDNMYVTVTATKYVKGAGTFKIPINATVNKSGISEWYWKDGD